MSFFEKIKGTTNFLRNEIKQHFDSWLLILLASIIVVTVVSVILMTLSKTAIFPKDNERYDIDTIYVGQMKDFCPKEFTANPGRKEFESCIPKLDMNKMVEVKIPTFKDTINTSPNLPYIMKNSSNPKIQKASNYFREGNYFIVGIKIPEKFFSKDGGYIKNGKINGEITNYNILTFKGVRFGLACIDNSCNKFLSTTLENISQIPLIRNETSNSNTVWIFGTENTSPHGLWLENGVFITKLGYSSSIRSFYSLSIFGRPMFVSIAFIALFLVSLPFAIYLRRFLDYSAFSYFAGSTTLWFMAENTSYFIQRSNTGSLLRLFVIWSTFNFILSILILNLAYARFKFVLKKKYFIVSHLIILGLVLSAYFYFDNLGAVVAAWGTLVLIFASLATLCALTPLCYRIYSLSEKLKSLKDQKKSAYLDYKRRIKELVIYSLAWIIFCSSYISFAVHSLGTGNVNDSFFSVSMLVALLLLGVMLYYTQSKEVTHMGEALAKQAQFMAHDIRRPFSQVKLVLSMFNSFSSDPKRLDEAKQDIEKSIKHVESMLSDIIESTGNINLNIKSSSIKDIVDQAFLHIKTSHIDRINIIKSINDTDVVSGDEQKLVRCFINILENAVQAVNINHGSDDKGLIEISTKKVNLKGFEHIEISVANNGPRIDDKDMSKLFESFFTRGKAKGTGLGLAFTHRVISLHEGSIKAKNMPGDDGVEFIISLPASKEAPLYKSIQNPKTDQYNFLLLDDETAYRSLVKTMINESSSLNKVSVFEAASVREAIDITEKNYITHALVDYDLKGNDTGFTYFDYINNKKLNINCALHTNKYIDQEMRSKIDKHNISYIPKPLDPDKLNLFIQKNN